MRNTFLLSFIFFLIHNILSAQAPLQKGQAVVTFHVGPYVAKVINTRNNGLACPGVNWDGTSCPPGATLFQPLTWTAANMGAIFGIAINDANGDIFFASSPILQDAFFQVSSNGIIFRAKGNTFALNTTFIINNPAYGIYLGTNQISNQQAGFGDIAHDTWHNQLFATNLYDGKIYRIRNLNNPSGIVASVYDPFDADPGNTTFPVGQQQKCWGVGVNRDNDGKIRVYFAREAGLTGQSEIWSVELNGSGDFVTGTETFEFNGPTPGVRIPDLAFEPGDRMLLAERLGNGDHSSAVWEYIGTHLAWTPKQQVPIGDYSINQNCAGGVDYGYRQSANDTMSLGECSKLIWASSDAIRYPSPKIYGICGIPAGGPFTPYLSNALMVDFDGNISDSDVKGDLGDVEIYRDVCPPKDICDQISANGAQIDDPAAGKCCWSIGLNNAYEGNYFSAVQFCGLDGVQISYSGVSSTWDVLGHTPTTVTIAPHGGAGIPKDAFPDVVELCLSGYTTAPQKVVVKWLGPDPNNAVICMDTLRFDCPTSDNPRCVRVINDTLSCKDGKYTFTFDLENFAPFNVQSFMITPLDPNITVTPALTNLPFPGIPTGGIGGTFTVNLTGSGLIPGNTFCFYLTAHNVPIGGGNFPQECCTDSVIVNCVPIPDCDPCDGVTITPDMAANPTPPGACCILLSMQNNYYPGYFTGIQVVGLGGVQLSYVSGWAIDPPVYPSSVTFIPPGGTLGTGSFSNFAQICLNNFTTSPQYFVVNLLGPDSTVVCSDTFPSFCTPPPPPTCAVAVNDSLWCEGGQVKYTFSIQNSPLNTFNIESFNLLLADPTGFNVTQQYFVLSTPLAPGNTAGPFTIDVWGSAVIAGDSFCYIMTAHNGVWGGDPADYPTTCCTDSLNVRCLTIPDCDGISQDSCCCCTAQDLQLPNGFSPNGDGVHDIYKITKLTPGKNCGKISLTVFNRWGNIVWQSSDYQDNWGGTNQSGTSLPEGTYYVLMKIESTGLTLTNFVELRR